MKTGRSYEPEILDLGPSHYSQEEYDDCMVQLARIGKLLGGDKASLQMFYNLPKVGTILDVGCGGGTFAIELARKFPHVEITGIDISPQAIKFANKQLKGKNLNNVHFEVPSNLESFASHSFDVVTSTLVCHHLNDEQLIDFLRQSYRVAKQAVVINDLHRHWLAYSSFRIIAQIFFPNRLIYHDGLLSIKRAFKKHEWIKYLNAAGIPLEQCSISWHWAFRWVVCIDTSKSSMQKQ